jgi:hypothetical protein
MIVCPDCGGRGESQGVVLVCRADGTGESRYEKAKCRVCDGVGRVTQERADDYHRGRADRESRVHGDYKTQRERAAEIGITPQELSRWEAFGERWTPR